MAQPHEVSTEFALMPLDLTKEHTVLKKAMIAALLDFHKNYGRTAHKYLDISVGTSALKILASLDDALDAVGLKIVRK